MKRIIRRLSALLCVLALCLTPASALSVEDAIGLLEANYVDALPSAAYEAKTLGELFDAVGDPYTYYLSPESYLHFQDVVDGEISVSGIGVSIDYSADGITITSILPGGGAEDAGLVPGDRIIAIDGVSCVPAVEAHRDLIVGESGTFVDLTIVRTDGTTQDFHIERRLVEIHNTNVFYDDDSGVCIIDCDSFGSLTKSYFYNGILDHPDAKLWVVDLRSNPGGLTDPATYALGLFTGFGYKLFFRNGDGRISYDVYLADRLTDKPIITLVNGSTASSAEILSGGIRAEGAGIVLGSRTYGKGSAQLLFNESVFPEFFDGDALKITAYRFYNGDGCTTDHIGVLPTLLVDDRYVDEIVRLLSAEPPATSERLCLTLNGIPFYVDPYAALSEGHGGALSELLSALAPDAELTFLSGGVERQLTPEQALTQFFGKEAASRCFTDVASSPYATQINTLAVYEILGGDGKGHFAPHNWLTRAELAQMLAHALGLTNGPSDLFSDVPADCPYAKEVGAVVSLGLMDGTGDGHFDPDAGLTQEQLLTVMGRLARFLNFEVEAFASTTPDAELETDALTPFASWARLNVLTLAECYGYSDMLYTELARIDPHAGVTRAQAAAELCVILKTLRILSY